MQAERFEVSEGLSFFREYRTWLVDAAVGGVRVKRSLKTRDKTEALQKALDFVRGHEDLPSCKRVSLKKACDLYEEAYRKENRPSSVERTMPVVWQFAKFVGDEKPTRALQREDVLRFRDKRMEGASGWNSIFVHIFNAMRP